jgi:N-acetylglucosaminyl-diphospho-decaprenol L-rhamnosyltransferase
MVSIVIVNWNSGPLLRRCVDSLLTHATGCEIVVVDNASRDGSLGPLDSVSGLTLLRNSVNLGFAAGCNLGWRRTQQPYVLFLNPDTEALSGSVEALCSAVERAPEIWGAAGRLSSPEGRHDAAFNVRHFPTVGGVAAEMFFLHAAWPGNPWTSSYRADDLAGGAAVAVDQPAGACLMVKRHCLEALGGFDEQFTPAWFEDVDLCKRIWDSGGQILFEPSARFLHQGGFSVGQLGYESFVRHYRVNQVRYFAKHHGAKAARRVRRLVCAGMFARSAASIVWPLAGNSSRLRSARLFWRIACSCASRHGLGE